MDLAEIAQASELDVFEDRTCLVVDDDAPFRQRLAGALARVGFAVSVEGSVEDGVHVAVHNPPAFAVVDLRLTDGSGLDVIEALHRRRADARSVVLTGYGAIPATVAAIKSGAQNVLTKPADIEDIVKALVADPDEMPEPPEHPATPDRVRWEHILSVYEQCEHNVSETARRLNMHRRTLQRMLQKSAPV
ncbi:MAG: ActR/PrrA/RegA family redox response regulator transcription factor [Pseudomonadota bacterium]